MRQEVKAILKSRSSDAARVAALLKKIDAFRRFSVAEAERDDARAKGGP